MRKERKIINTNIRLNLCDEQDRQAWEYLQTMDREKYKSYTRAVVVALNDYFSREYRNEADPYLETREKEDAFLERVETAVRDGVKESVPMAIAKNLMEMLVPFVKESVGEINLPDRTLTMEKTDEEIAEDNLDAMAGGVVHQGAAALLKPYEYAELDKVLSDWEGKDPILILLDGLEDVRNLGAIVRTAECAGAAAVLLPKHKSPPVTAAAMKTAAGAFAYLPVCQTGNIRQTLEGLKEKGFWVVGADMDGESLYYDADLKGPLVIVMGAEGKGVSPLTRKLCDFCVRIPMKGKVSSLNVSVAAALLIYEAAKQRGE